MFPSVQKLALHLPREQLVYLRANESAETAMERSECTTLTAFFQLNIQDESANHILYCDILKYYSYNKKERKFKVYNKVNISSPNFAGSYIM